MAPCSFTQAPPPFHPLPQARTRAHTAGGGTAPPLRRYPPGGRRPQGLLPPQVHTSRGRAPWLPPLCVQQVARLPLGVFHLARRAGASVAPSTPAHTMHTPLLGGRLRGSLPLFGGRRSPLGSISTRRRGRERLLPPLCVLHPPCTCRGAGASSRQRPPPTRRAVALAPSTPVVTALRGRRFPLGNVSTHRRWREH